LHSALRIVAALLTIDVAVAAVSPVIVRILLLDADDKVVNLLLASVDTVLIHRPPW